MLWDAGERGVPETMIEKNKGKYGIKYPLHQHLMGPALMAGGPTLKMEFPHLRFSTLTTVVDEPESASECMLK